MNRSKHWKLETINIFGQQNGEEVKAIATQSSQNDFEWSGNFFLRNKNENYIRFLVDY